MREEGRIDGARLDVHLPRGPPPRDRSLATRARGAAALRAGAEAHDGAPGAFRAAATGTLRRGAACEAAHRGPRPQAGSAPHGRADRGAVLRAVQAPREPAAGRGRRVLRPARAFRGAPLRAVSRSRAGDGRTAVARAAAGAGRARGAARHGARCTAAVPFGSSARPRAGARAITVPYTGPERPDYLAFHG